MDYTLIKTKSEVKLDESSLDWDVLSQRVPTKLRRLHTDGYRIVVFTNQGGVALGMRTID